MARKNIEQVRQIPSDPGVAQPIHHQIHPQRENDDLPGCLAQHLPGADDMAARSHAEQKQRTEDRDGADRHAQRFKTKVPEQQERQHHPPDAERGRIVDGLMRLFELRHVVLGGDAGPEIEQQHDQAGGDRGDIHRDHDRGIGVEADVEEIGRDDIDQIGHHQWQAGRIGDEAGGHDESQRCRRTEAERQQHRHHDRRQNQRCAVIGEQGRHGCAQQDQEGEESAPVAAPPTCHTQRRPLEKAGFIEQQADDDGGNESNGGVPNDVPNRRNIGEMNHAGQKGGNGAESRAPADAQPAWLPDHQDERGDEDQQCDQHRLSSCAWG